MSEAKRFPSACVASPHYLASAAGLAVLASGGNAVDAAVAVNLTLGAVTPYLCGFGGDLFAMVWDGATLHAYNGSGRAPAAATPERVGAGEMPRIGPLSVTVPGAVEAWFALLERFGSRSFASLATPALRYARDGFTPTRAAMSVFEAFKGMYPQSGAWRAVYERVGAGAPLRQPELARTIDSLCTRGPDAYYRGEIASAIASSLEGWMSVDDLASHRGEWVEPLRITYQSVDLFEMPPNSQGVAALEALNIAEGAGSRDEHTLMEAMKLALADRDAYVSDPEYMPLPASKLASKAWADERRSAIDSARAGSPAPGRVAVGGTAYMCAADAGGMCVSLIQSNYMGFGSGVTVPGWGINLQNRGAFFSLDPSHVNVIAPRKRTMHTLAPAMAFRGGSGGRRERSAAVHSATGAAHGNEARSERAPRDDGRPWLVFGSMGGDGQCQTHLQLVTRIVDDGEDVQRAIDAPRWVVSPSDWSVTAEPRFADGVLAGLRERGHRVTTCGRYDPTMGHAHAILVGDDGYAGATDPRAEGAVLGI